MVIVVMGVSGVGKTTVGKALAERIGARFAEGDQFHSPENVEKMRMGRPLNDQDRLPWLQTLNGNIGEWERAGETVVLSCSALKRKYRDQLCAGHTGVQFLFLEAEKEVVAQRVNARTGHYMPASLLDSQYRDLEAPEPQENVVTVDGGASVEEILERVLGHFQHPRR